jgi:hypothetical protein
MRNITEQEEKEQDAENELHLLAMHAVTTARLLLFPVRAARAAL